MQKWEYMVVRSYGGVVVLVNGQEVAQMGGAQPVGEMLYEFLNRVGGDGWEVVAMAGVREGTEMTLKRPSVEAPPEYLEEAEELEEPES